MICWRAWPILRHFAARIWELVRLCSEREKDSVAKRMAMQNAKRGGAQASFWQSCHVLRAAPRHRSAATNRCLLHEDPWPVCSSDKSRMLRFEPSTSHLLITRSDWLSQSPYLPRTLEQRRFLMRPRMQTHHLHSAAPRGRTCNNLQLHQLFIFELRKKSMGGTIGFLSS